MQFGMILALFDAHHDPDNVYWMWRLIFLIHNAKNICQICFFSHELQNITNTNDDRNNNDTKYHQQSSKQYDLLFLFICDNAKMNDKESSDATTNSIIQGCESRDTKSQLLAWFMYKVSAIQQSMMIKSQTKCYTNQRLKVDIILLQDCFNIAVCCIKYLQEKILADAINFITDFACFEFELILRIELL